MQRQPLQAFVQQFDLLNVIELDNLCMHLTDHLHEYLEQTQVTVTQLLPGQCTKALILTIHDVINKSAQQDNMLSFVGIDPHGLTKISQTLLISFEEREACLQKPLQLNQEIILECLTDCMRRIRLEIAKERIVVGFSKPNELSSDFKRGLHSTLDAPHQGVDATIACFSAFIW